MAVSVRRRSRAQLSRLACQLLGLVSNFDGAHIKEPELPGGSCCACTAILLAATAAPSQPGEGRLGGRIEHHFLAAAPQTAAVPSIGCERSVPSLHLDLVLVAAHDLQDSLSE